MPVLQALHAEWQAHADREVALTELAAARREHEAVERRLERAVAAGRAAGLSWAQNGQATGIGRQSSHQAWRHADLYIRQRQAYRCQSAHRAHKAGRGISKWRSRLLRD